MRDSSSTFIIGAVATVSGLAALAFGYVTEGLLAMILGELVDMPGRIASKIESLTR